MNEMAKGTGKERRSAGFTAHGARLLAVDDTAMNLSIFKALLEGHGLHIDTAQSGAECLRLAGLHKYDVIFMDQMMPELSGTEVFRKIRGAGRLNGETPVIMLTANISDGEGEKFISEGFAAYLPKPVNSERLISMLLEYLPPEKVRFAAEKASPGEGSGRFARLKEAFPELDLEAAPKNCGGKEDLYADMLKVFTVPSRTAELEDAFARGDWERYAMLIHTVKGSMRTFGLAGAGKLAESLQKAAEERDAALVAQSHPAMTELLSRLAEQAAAL